MKLQKKYAILKGTTIALGALTIPWGTFTGFCFGEGRYFTGLVSLCAQTVVALADGYIWFWVLENMRNRIQKETDRQSEGISTMHGVVCPLFSGNNGASASILNESDQVQERERAPIENIYSERERQGIL